MSNCHSCGGKHAAMRSHFSRVWLFATLWTIPARLLCPWDSPGKHTGVGCHAFLQGIFLTQGLNSGLLQLLHFRQILYHCATRDAHIYIYIYINDASLGDSWPRELWQWYPVSQDVTLSPRVRLLCDECVNMSPRSCCQGWDGHNHRAGGEWVTGYYLASFVCDCANNQFMTV